MKLKEGQSIEVEFDDETYTITRSEEEQGVVIMLEKGLMCWQVRPIKNIGEEGIVRDGIAGFPGVIIQSSRTFQRRGCTLKPYQPSMSNIWYCRGKQ